MNVVVLTGASGFIGRVVHRRLTDGGCAVVELSRAVAWTATSLSGFLADHQPDVILHLASAPPPAPEQAHRQSCADALSLLAAAGEACPRARIMTLGSAAEYGLALHADRAMTEDDPCLPQTPYAKAKHEVTQAFAQARVGGIDAVVLRLFTAVGPDMPAHLLLGSVARQISADPSLPIQVGPLDSARDYLDVNVVADLIVALALHPLALPDLINLASGQAISVREIVFEMIRCSGVPCEIIETSARMVSDSPRVWGDTQRLNALGYTPQPMTPHQIALRALASAGRS